MTANDRVREMMEKLNIKQRDILEKEPRLRQNTLSSNLRDSVWPNGLLAAALSTHWGINLNWVYTGEGAETLQESDKQVQIAYLKQQIEDLASVTD
ncbi:helix-turn-helix domain containing protein [Aureispira anguillae]|uniref:Helix-turn-helix domain containing protein n=1 Tax=Aureispira anguillae TaxID=2864201 RepID=A0A915YBP0_9BACT|nr:helix-turn-helix domain containing protein [Aureispira anguillae]BDS10127.1 helix-turn-helix domain containing protein [Aureispira anguillae]